MIHQPLGGASGQATDMEISVRHILKTKAKTTKMIADFCNKPLEEVAKDCERDYWMDASEALEYGIVDKVV